MAGFGSPTASPFANTASHPQHRQPFRTLTLPLAMTPIELLCPAKNLDIAREAINNGADAVYIGGPSFGARAAAGNSVDDIASLVSAST